MLSKPLGYGDNWITVGKDWQDPNRQFDPTRQGLFEALALATKLKETLKISLATGEYIPLD
jgi:hypothetical protein